MLPKLTADLRVPFQLGENLQRTGDTRVHEALREALVNAIIHADYEGRVALLVTEEPGAFVLRNPGGLRLSKEQIREGGHSDCRNRTLQEMFQRVGLGERAGSGFSRILRAWREQHWQTPLLEEDTALDATTLRLDMSSLIPPEVTRDLERRFGRDFTELPPDGRRSRSPFRRAP